MILVEEQCHGHIEMIAGYTNDPVRTYRHAGFWWHLY